MFLVVVFATMSLIHSVSIMAHLFGQIHSIMLHLLNRLDMENKTKLQQLFSLLSKLPKWARAAVIFLIAIILSIVMMTSCASTQRIAIKIKDTPSGVSITTSQSADSSGTSINLNPTINFPRQ